MTLMALPVAFQQQNSSRSMRVLATETGPDAAEYDVWSALLSKKYLKEYAKDELKTLVIVDHTIGTKSGPFTGVTYGLTFSGAKPPSVQPSTQADFDAKGTRTSVLADAFDSKLTHVLVPEDRLRDTFGHETSGQIDKDGWHRFYEKYPSAAGIFAISRVGFNTAGNQALVFVIRKGGPLNGCVLCDVEARRCVGSRKGGYDLDLLVHPWSSRRERSTIRAISGPGEVLRSANRSAMPPTSLGNGQTSRRSSNFYMQLPKHQGHKTQDENPESDEAHYQGSLVP